MASLTAPGAGWAPSRNATVAFWLAFVVLVPLAALEPATVGVLGLALLAVAAWLAPARATAWGAIAAYAIRPSLDAIGQVALAGGNPASLFGIAILLVGTTVALRRLHDGQPLWPDRLFGAAQSLNIALHLLLVTAGAMAYAAVGLGTGTRDLVRVVSTLAAGLLMIWWVDSEDPRRIPQALALLAVGSAVPMLAGVYQWMTDSGDHTEPGLNRLYGTFTHPQTYGAFLIPLIMLGLAGLVRLRGRARTVALAWTAATSTLLVLTYSRTFLLVLAVSLGTYFFLRSGGLSMRETARVVGLAMVVAIAGWLAFGDAIRERFLGIAISSDAVYEALSGGSQNSFQWRVINWATLLQLGMERPLLGHGLGMTMVLNPLISPGSNKPFNAHDDFVRFFFEGGVVGLALHALQLGLFALWLWRVSRQTRGARSVEVNAIVASLLALYLFTGGTTEMSLNTAVNYEVFLLIGLLCASRRLSRAERGAETAGIASA